MLAALSGSNPNQIAAQIQVAFRKQPSYLGEDIMVDSCFPSLVRW